MSTQEPRSAPAAAGRFAFKSINQKVIASVALLLIIGLGGLVAYQSHTSRVLALNTFDDSNAILTRTRTWSVSPADSGHGGLMWTTLRRFGG